MSASPLRIAAALLIVELGISVPWFWTGSQSRHKAAGASVVAGFSYRALATTTRDTHDWWIAQSP